MYVLFKLVGLLFRFLISCPGVSTISGIVELLNYFRGGSPVLYTLFPTWREGPLANQFILYNCRHAVLQLTSGAAESKVQVLRSLFTFWSSGHKSFDWCEWSSSSRVSRSTDQYPRQAQPQCVKSARITRVMTVVLEYVPDEDKSSLDGSRRRMLM